MSYSIIITAVAIVFFISNVRAISRASKYEFKYRVLSKVLADLHRITSNPLPLNPSKPSSLIFEDDLTPIGKPTSRLAQEEIGTPSSRLAQSEATTPSVIPALSVIPARGTPPAKAGAGIHSTSSPSGHLATSPSEAPTTSPSESPKRILPTGNIISACGACPHHSVFYAKQLSPSGKYYSILDRVVCKRNSDIVPFFSIAPDCPLPIAGEQYETSKTTDNRS